MSSLYTVEVAPGLLYDCEAKDDIHLAPNDTVVLKFKKYQDYGRVKHTVCSTNCGQHKSSGKGGGKGDDSPRIIRHMNLVDQGRATENEARARSMFRTAQRKAQEHRLDMKFINCHYVLDKSVVIFQFSAEGRIDFRNLVKDLSGALRNRIELRQVGVRDEAAIQGGIGPCGRPFCCATVLDKFRGVNVKMAKAQGLSLNPTSVSGGCGRLKCCLRYEVDTYREMARVMPRVGHKIDTPQGTARVVDCEPLEEKVKVRLEEGERRIITFAAEELGYGLKQSDKPATNSGSY
ncbi:MAG: regulatory iron-sulfur-containing complex subunit RicT [Lentisphaeria bacterium]